MNHLIYFIYIRNENKRGIIYKEKKDLRMEGKGYKIEKKAKKKTKRKRLDLLRKELLKE